MKTAWKWIAGVLILAILLVGARSLYNYLSEEYAPEPLAPVPTATTAPETTGSTEPQTSTAPDYNFTVYDGQGQPVELADMAGKPVVLNFWASWCGFCVQEMPDFEEMYRKYGQDVHFMMVNMTDGRQETLESAKAFLEGKDFTFPVYFDTAVSAASMFYAGSLPVTYFLDANGQVVTYANGMLESETLEKGIGILLSQ